jgi:predicted small secreted protein
MMKKLMLVLVALTVGSPVFLTGCNTVQGAGKDVEKGGQQDPGGGGGAQEILIRSGFRARSGCQR